MPTAEDIMNKELEEQFLSGLENAATENERLIEIVGSIRESGQHALAEEWAALLQDELNALADKEPALRLWECRATWLDAAGADRVRIRSLADSIYRRDPPGLKFVANSGLDDATLPLVECVRRFRLLRTLADGVMCYHKTWGFGLVRDADDFYERVTIDFDQKVGHQLSFAYTAESLELLADDHLLAIRHRNPEGLATLFATDPAEIVRIVLRGYGSVNVARLQEILSPDFVAEADWKKFWDAARRGLKSDALVDIPTKRNDPLVLRTREKSFGDTWVTALSAETDMKRILAGVRDFDASGTGPLEADDAARVCERLEYVIHAALKRDPNTAVTALVASRKFGMTSDVPVARAVLERCLNPTDMTTLMSALSARNARSVLEWMVEYDADRALDVMAQCLPAAPMPLFAACIDELLENGRSEACSSALRRMYRGRSFDVDQLTWLGRHMNVLTEWDLGRLSDLPIMILDVIEHAKARNRNRGLSQLSDIFLDRDLLQKTLADATDQERRDLVARIRRSTARGTVDAQAAVARMINLFPHLREDGAAEALTPAPVRSVTSWRSYRERQADLQKVVEVDIPANSKEIALARSYGDLKENHEYKSAKEMQAVLMQRQGSMEADLKRVVGSDFSEFPSDRAGVGTRVELRRASGTTETYHVLGEWDRDETLAIISSGSRVAELLDGHTVGDTIDLPAGEGVETCEIVSVSDLEPEVAQWVSGEVDTLIAP